MNTSDILYVIVMTVAIISIIIGIVRAFIRAATAIAIENTSLKISDLLIILLGGITLGIDIGALFIK